MDPIVRNERSIGFALVSIDEIDTEGTPLELDKGVASERLKLLINGGID